MLSSQRDKTFSKQSSLARHKYEHSGEHVFKGPQVFSEFILPLAPQVGAASLMFSFHGWGAGVLFSLVECLVKSVVECLVKSMLSIWPVEHLVQGHVEHRSRAMLSVSPRPC